MLYLILKIANPPIPLVSSSKHYLQL